MDVEARGIYDPREPHTNIFEIPGARDNFIRHFDTGVVYGYGNNPKYAGLDDDEKDEAERKEVNKYYKKIYPEVYEE